MYVIHLMLQIMAGILWITFMVLRVQIQWTLNLVHHSSQSLLSLLNEKSSEVNFCGLFIVPIVYSWNYINQLSKSFILYLIPCYYDEY